MGDDGASDWLGAYFRANTDAFAGLAKIQAERMEPLRATLEAVRAKQTEPFREALTAYYDAAGLNQSIRKFRDTVLNPSSLSQLNWNAGLAASIREFQRSYTANIATPELQASLAAISDAVLRVGDTARVGMYARQEVLRTVTDATGTDLDDANQLCDELAADLTHDADSDPSIRPLRKFKVSSLTNAQRGTVTRFIGIWAANFGFDLGLLTAAFADLEYVGDIFVWASVLATIQLIIWVVVLAPKPSED